jgi:molecular chaperone DnaK
VFTTTRDQQSEVTIQVLQGESRVATDNIKLGELTLTGIRPAPRGTVHVEVTFEIDTDGLVSIRARDVDTGVEQGSHVKVSAGYSEHEISSMKERLKAPDIAVVRS